MLRLDDALQVLRNTGSLRVRASQYQAEELIQMARNIVVDKGGHLVIVLDVEVMIENMVAIAANGRGGVMFDAA